MHGIQLIQDLALILVSAGVATVICQRLKQPVVLGYILVGILIGPHSPPFNFVSNEEEIRGLAELGVILLMFSVGLHFSFRKLREVGWAAVVAALMEIAGMFSLGHWLGQAFGWSTMDAIFLGAILSISSTTIIAKTLESLGLLRPGFAKLVFGILIVEDVLAIAMMGVLTNLGTTGEVDLASVGQILIKLIAFFVSVAVVGFLFVPSLIRLASKTKLDEVLLVTVLGLIFGLALLAEKLGFSVALGAFLVGAVLAEVREVHRIERLVAPVRDLFAAIFFTSSGILINFNLSPQGLLEVAIISLLVIVGKIIFSGLGALLGGCDLRTAIRAAMSLAQIGEFSFIIAGLGMSLGATGERLYSLAVLVSAVTTLTTPYLVAKSGWVADWVEQKAPCGLLDFWRLYQRWLHAFQPDPKNRHHQARMLGQKLILQMGLQLALLTAPFLVAAGFWTAYRERLPEAIRTAWWGGPLLWLGGALLALPVIVALLRKYHALSMLGAEMVFPRRPGQGEVRSARTLLELFLGGIGATVFGLYLILISSPLLPSAQVLLGLLLGLALLGLASWQRLIRLYAKAQASIHETWEAIPDQKQVELPESSEVRGYRVEKGSVLAGQTLLQTGLRKQSGVVVVAIERVGRNVVSPGPEEILREQDELFIFGERDQLELAEPYLQERGVIPV